MKLKRQRKSVAHLADMISAMGNEQRLMIMRLLLQSHPEGMVVGDIQSELGIPGSTLSHHLEKLKIAGLVSVKRESQFLRYKAEAQALEEILAFLFSECCARSSLIEAESFISFCRKESKS
jgi:DNA-binding transcriptional ArsR family regulator